MIRFKKQDELSATYLPEDHIWEMMLTTTLIRENEDGEKQHSYSVKTYDIDFDRASAVLYEATTKYFDENMKRIFGKEGLTNVSNKGDEVSNP